MTNRELETITFGETQKIADENDTEFSKVFEILCDVRDTLQVKESVRIPSLSVRPIGRPKGSRGTYKQWKTAKVKKLIKLYKAGKTPKQISVILGKTRRQVSDKLNYELNKN